MKNEQSEDEILAEMARLDAENRKKREARAAVEGKTVGEMIGNDPNLSRLEEMIEEAPETRPEPEPEPFVIPTLPDHFPARYREPWAEATSKDWAERFEKGLAVVNRGAMLALVGPRGTGKTRLAAEIARSTKPKGVLYSTAFDFFVEIKATYGQKARETEKDVLDRFRRRSLLILDEVQERSESDWENRCLTSVLDGRYSGMLPTILIANLEPKALAENLGNAIADRIAEGGGLITIDGASFRRQTPQAQ